MSLVLEALDFVAPLLQRLIGRAGNALSWLLVRLIGRSLGLIYRGCAREPRAPGQGWQRAEAGQPAAAALCALVRLPTWNASAHAGQALAAAWCASLKARRMCWNDSVMYACLPYAAHCPFVEMPLTLCSSG